MDKLVIACALAGAVTSKLQTPYVPDSPKEMAEEAYRAFNAGAHIVHLHARDSQGKNRDRVDVLNETVQLIRDKCKVIIQIGTGASDHTGRRQTDEERLKLLEIKPKPDMETINAGTFSIYARSKKAQQIYSSFTFQNSLELMSAFAKGMKERGMGIEFEIYDLSHIGNVLALVQDGILKKEELNLDFVMGMGGGIFPTPKCLMYLVEQTPPEAHWSVLGISQAQFPMISMGIILGGGIRVGLEDNIYVSKGVLAKSNADLVEKAVRIAKELGREIATLDEARKILRLPT
jgi:3-keto-5-aminohexanoate cleavage enzyme